MNYQTRLLETRLQHTLERGKSVLLLGARQTGKTTLLKNHENPSFYYDFSRPIIRRQFEQHPDSLSDEIEAFWKIHSPKKPPLVIIDEVQKVPDVIDIAQYLIDNQRAQFVLTGSSARKLKKRDQGDTNLLPGRVLKLQLDALTLMEMGDNVPDLKTLLLYGSLPFVFFEEDCMNKADDLLSYTDIYLEEEVRQEALVRNLAAFSRFLELAAIESGHPINLTKLSQDIGVHVHVISEYFQILEDSLIAEKITSISEADHASRRRLTSAPKYLFFDVGIRRICAKEGIELSEEALGRQLEQWVGIELCRYLRLFSPQSRLRYWRDHNGPEVDYVIDTHHVFLPIEVKWTENPRIQDCRHLQKFMDEYPCQAMAFLVCRTPRKRLLSEKIMALPWQELPDLIKIIQPEYRKMCGL